MKITRLQFYTVTLLLILLPLSLEYKLLLFGEKISGVTVAKRSFQSQNRGDTFYSEIAYGVDGYNYTMFTPSEVVFKVGEHKELLYDSTNPSEAILANPIYIYVSPVTIIPVILMLMWLAYYSSYKKKLLKS